MAVRTVIPEAFDIFARGAERIVAVDDHEVAEAIRLYYRNTHNLAEGAGAAALAALMQEKDAMRGKKAGVILCGGNIDTELLIDILQGGTPQVKVR